jgi:hypothetical protein
MSEKTTAPIPRSNMLQSALDDSTADDRNHLTGHKLSRNHTYVGNLSSYGTPSNDLLRSNSMNDMHRRPSVGGQSSKLHTPPGPITTAAGQRPVSPYGGVKDGSVSPLPRRNTDGITPPRIDTALLRAKKSYEGLLQRPLDGSNSGGHSPSSAFPTTNLSTGNEAKLTRSDTRAQALALARQNSIDRRSPVPTNKASENGGRLPVPNQNGGGVMRRQLSARELGTSSTLPTSRGITTNNNNKANDNIHNNNNKSNNNEQWNTAALAASIPEGKVIMII